MTTQLGNGGPPIRTIWAWVLIDADGQEAFCRSPWSVAASLIGPDQDMIETPTMKAWAHSYAAQHGWRVELRRFEVRPLVLDSETDEEECR